LSWENFEARIRAARKVLRGHKRGEGSEAETTVEKAGSTQRLEASLKPSNLCGTLAISGLWSD
jgi:hypothetical protein